MKKIGFLSFGHWTPSPQSGTQSATDALLQSIDLTVEAERLEPRKEPNFSYRLLRAVYPVFRVLFPNQVIRADELAMVMMDIELRRTQECQGLVFENRDIRAMVESFHPPAA